MTRRFGKCSILAGVCLNVLILAGALGTGFYLLVTECTNDLHYSSLCKLGGALIWIGTLAFVGLVFFAIFGFIIVKMEKEIEDLMTKKELPSNSVRELTLSKASVSPRSGSLTVSSAASFDEIRPKLVPLTGRSNIPPKVQDFGKAATLLKKLNQE
ncbi:unnamed protein product [Rodentolepis nana]|uniref:Uncharacterized protein n=1 Tax=Rodentolepis nana TaxID=102285 RepID=A0A0R3TWU8_RODNA|nr:unnamed protein product [Rodentolepis nana]